MDSESENESIEGDLIPETERADWGKAKYDYYYTDYVDKDYPNKLSHKEERLAAIEQEEALRIQKKLLSTLDNVTVDLQAIVDDCDDDSSSQDNLIDLIERQNKTLISPVEKTNKRKKVKFEEPAGSDELEFDEDEDEDDDDDDDSDKESEQVLPTSHQDDQGHRRRPINMAIKKNRGLTPYKKKEYRNPRVKHKLKFKKAMTKRRRLVKEAQTEYHRYNGEATGIKTSTIKSIKLC